MATLTGTRVLAPRNAGLDELVYASGYYTFPGTTTVVSGNDIEFDLFAGLEGYDLIPVDATVWGAELDINASGTVTFTAGDSADADGLLKTQAGFFATGATQINCKGNGDLIKNQTRLTGTKVYIDITGTVGTGATSGDIFIGVWAKVVAKV